MNKHRYVRLFLASAFFALMGMVTMGCKQNQGNPTVTEMFTVTFAKPEHGTITAAIKGGKAIKTGDKVAKGTVIVFTATPDTGFTFEKWTGALTGTTTPAELKVINNVTVSTSFKAAPPPLNPGQGEGSNPNPDNGGGQTPPSTEQEYKVTFARPKYGQLEAIIVGDNSPIVSGRKVKTGTKIKFNVVYDDSKFKVVKWTGLSDGIDQTSATQTVTVTSDITVSVELGTLPVPEGKVRILFDSSKIGCSNGTTQQFVNPGDAVAENTQLTFSAPGVEIAQWLVNGSEKSDQQTFKYMVIKADAKDSMITVTYKEKEKPVISFDSSKVTVKIHAAPPRDTKINPGDKISYGTALHFTVQPSQGMIVDQWMINSVNKTPKFKPYGNNIYTYTVDISDVQNGKLDITFTEKPKVSKKITFDASQIEVYKKYNSTLTKIVTGTEVTENDELAFRATLALGRIVDEWQINGRKIDENRSYVFNHIVKDADFSEQGMELKITTKNSVQGKLKLGDKVTCKKVVNPITNETDSIQTGADIQETDVLYLESSETGTGYWKINDKRAYGIGPGLPFVVEAKYFVGGTMKIEFVNTNG